MSEGPSLPCPRCGTRVATKQHFCQNCGAGMGVDSSLPTIITPEHKNTSRINVPPPPPEWSLQEEHPMISNPYMQQASPYPSPGEYPLSFPISKPPSSTRRKWKVWLPLVGLFALLVASLLLYSIHTLAPSTSHTAGTQVGQTSSSPLTPTLTLSPIATTVSSTTTIQIYDSARVLDTTSVRAEGTNLPYPIDIYTTNNFQGSTAEFDKQAANSINRSNLIVIAIDTVHKHLAIFGSRDVPLTSSQYANARDAFVAHYGNGDYTGATIAAIRSLRNSMGTTYLAA
jgi:Mycobacterium membrane protein